MSEKQKGWNICGERVRQIRKHKKKKQVELADELSEATGVSINRTSIVELEKGDRYFKDFEIVALAKIWKLDVRWLLGMDGAEEPTDIS